MHPAKHFGLVIGLADFHRQTELFPGQYAHVDELGVTGDSVDVDLAHTEAAKIRSVQHVHLHDETSR